MKKYLTIGLICLVLGGGVGFGAALLTKSNATEAGATCSQTGNSVVTHKVMIMDDMVMPKNTTGKLCDKLTITNMDTVTREIAFGAHEDHVPYDGVAERLLGKNQSLTLTLNQKGTYHFHDHEHDEVEGYFTVN